MHRSTFSYNLSRQYPYRWFTPVVAVGGTIAIVLFSFLNVYTTGYILVSDYPHNPNQTRYDSRAAITKLFDNGLKPQCQPASIAVNSQFYTNNSAFQYTVQSVTSAATNDDSLSTSVIYLNNVFTTCTIDQVEILYESTGRTAVQIAKSSWGVELVGTVYCSFNTNQGTQTLKLIAIYDQGYVEPVTVSNPTFLRGDNQRKSSLAWGRSLLWYYWARTTKDAQESQSSGNLSKIKGIVSFHRRQNVTDVLSSKFFQNLSCFFQYRSIDGTSLSTSFCNTTRDTLDRLIDPKGSSTIANQSLNIWASADASAKVFYSALMTDLGQVQESSNILVNETLLKYYSQNITRNVDGIESESSAEAVYSQYDPKNKSTDYPANLTVSPATILSQYSCQQLQRKSPGALIFTTLVANVAFLSALWGIFNFIVTTFLVSREPGANACECHAANGNFDATESLELLPVKNGPYKANSTFKRVQQVAPDE